MARFNFQSCINHAKYKYQVFRLQKTQIDFSLKAKSLKIAPKSLLMRRQCINHAIPNDTLISPKATPISLVKPLQKSPLSTNKGEFFHYFPNLKST